MMASSESNHSALEEDGVVSNGEGSTSNKQNGAVKSSNDDEAHEIDRYGFFGGTQYTDPNRSVILAALDSVLLFESYFYLYRIIYSESIIPVAILREREAKWLEMLENWEKWMSKRFKKVLLRQVYATSCL
jgi:hypothetical protein